MIPKRLPVKILLTVPFMNPRKSRSSSDASMPSSSASSRMADGRYSWPAEDDRQKKYRNIPDRRLYGRFFSGGGPHTVLLHSVGRSTRGSPMNVPVFMYLLSGFHLSGPSAIFVLISRYSICIPPFCLVLQKQYYNTCNNLYNNIIYRCFYYLNLIQTKKCQKNFLYLPKK